MVHEPQSYEAMLKEERIQCPYCGEMLTIQVDCSVETQSWYEDCQVCCRPLLLESTASVDGELLHLDVRRDDE